MKRKFNFLQIVLLQMFIVGIFPAFAQLNLEYQKPPKEILELADYERAPSVMLDFKKEYMLMTYRNTYKSLSDLNQDEMRLAGLRINPVTNISSTASYINNLKIRKITDKEETQIKGLPAEPRITFISWSPDDKKIAFTNTTDTGVELWVIDAATATAKKLTDAKVNANLGNPYSWYKSSDALLVRMLPGNRTNLIDTKKNLPTGPTVTVSDGSVSQNRTYQDLLKNKTDEANFDILTQSELFKVSIDGSKEKFMEKAIYIDESFSPDGNFIMLTTIETPYSYIVPLNRFPMTTKVYDFKGTLVKLINEKPLIEVTPKGFMACEKGMRDISWRADKPASIYYAVALDEGDPANKVEFRDEIFTWDAPFNQAAKPLVKTINRFGGITWGNDEYAILYDEWYDTRNAKTYLINPSKVNEAKIIWDRNSQDVYSDPGRFQTDRNEFGRRTLKLDKSTAYLIGAGYTENGQFPFIDEINLKNFKTKRLYQSKYNDRIESISSIIDYKKGDVLVNIQSKTDYPNYFIRNIKKESLSQITFNKNPFESIKDVHKEVIKYKRKDGVELSGTLYLPVGYDMNKKEKKPLLIWAYPQEYKDKNSAGQSTANPNEFTYPYYGSFVYWVTRGYVVLDDAAFPIVGEGEVEPNDTFIEQLVANAEAAIDAVDKLGYIDRTKAAVGGHSYGAFMTANLLTHSDLFACGIARSGAYNRTLTPFGFQSEQRNYWDVPSVYNQMSPFMTADKMKKPMLIVHGDADNNPGTFTLQSERYFQALKGLGAPVRLVLLPKESHGYAAKENILHLLWEQDQFLEKYLK